ncbi:MAG: outer membrane beta-barrel protein [Pseudomonadota bacterium]|nr:outer membrane beta-barrel protein [Pseudomonadota bacterium]
MKKHLLWGLLSASLLFGDLAHADFYAGAGLGGSFNGGRSSNGISSVKYKNSSFWSLAGGYELPLPLFDVRGELEYMRTRPEVKDGRTKQLDGLFLNGYADIPLIPIIDPYVGLGIGRTRFDHTNSFAIQGMLGAEYELPFAPVVMSGEYRYLKVNETTGKVNRESKYHSNILMLKARYMF